MLMFHLESEKTPLGPDLARFIQDLNDPRRLHGAVIAGFFNPQLPVIVTRAPGRLDVMGGIADYSGSLVLQMPTSEATFAAIQRQDSRMISLLSLQGEGSDALEFDLSLDELEKNGKAIEYEEARAFFNSDPDNRWAAYAAGSFLVLMRELGVGFASGVRIVIASGVPQGKGVSSSAALEVAVMAAVAASYGLDIEPVQMALLCQRVENAIAGAPCGLMDQMTSVCGKAGSLLALLCQPADLLEPVSIPSEIEIWGFDSGIRHAVSGSDYTSVRVGAFMGHRIIAEIEGIQVTAGDRPGLVAIDNAPWGAYLANVSPPEFEGKYAAQLPEQISGAEFVSRYQGTVDTVTQVDPSRTYAVRKPAAHPVYEHFRTSAFRDLLSRETSEQGMGLLGDMMFQSHASYSACGLGSDGTDLLVELVRKAGPSRGVYGARISGGGGGGTVVVLASTGASQTIAEIARKYGRMTGHEPYVFSGSSAGAAEFGHQLLMPLR